MSLKIDDVSYLAYRTPEIKGKDTGFDREIDLPHVTVAYKPPAPYLEELLINLPRESNLEVTHYGLSSKNEGVKVANPSIEKYVKVPHITLGVAQGGRPVDTAKIKFVPMKKPLLGGKDLDKIKTTENVKSVKRPDHIPETIKGVLSVRLKNGPNGEERWMPADEFIKENQGYTVKVYTPEMLAREDACIAKADKNFNYKHADPSDVADHREWMSNVRDHKWTEPKILHFNSLEECERWCNEYLKSLNQDGTFKGRAEIECVGDITSKLEGNCHFRFKDFSYEADSYGVRKEWEKAVPWEDVLNMHKAVVQHGVFSDDKFADGKVWCTKEECISRVANEYTKELCDKADIFLCDRNGAVGRVSLAAGDSGYVLRVESSDTIEDYRLPPDTIAKIEDVLSDRNATNEVVLMDSRGVKQDGPDLSGSDLDERD